jgi:hypothetical protein
MNMKDAIEISKEMLSKYHITFFRSRYDGSVEIINCLGSGTLIMLDQIPYILTAAHVIRELECIRKGGGKNGDIGWSVRHNTMIDFSERMPSIDLKLRHPKCDEESATYDVGLYPLDDNDFKYYKNIEKRSFYSIENIEGNSLSDGIYFVLGTPNSQSQCYPSLRTIYFEPASFQIEQDFSHNINGDPFTGIGKSRATFKIFVNSGKPILDYGGVSGGSVWCIEGGIAILRGVVSQSSSDGVMFCYMPPEMRVMHNDLLDIIRQRCL